MKKFLLSLALVLLSGAAMAQSTYKVTDEKIPSGDLNDKTEATYIAIKNLSATNHYYFVGNTGAVPYSKNDFSEAAVFIWEPAGDGKFYLKKTNGTYMQTSSPKDFGTIDNAAKFSTTNPTSTGNGATKFNGDGDSQTYINGNDDANLVRFVTGGKWINVQNGDGGTPIYNNGEGGWTIHYVYKVNVETAATMKDEEKAAAKAEALAIPTDIVGYPKSSAIEAFCNAVDAATYATEVVALKEEMLANVQNFVLPAEDKVYALDSYMQYIYNNVNGSTDLKTNGNSNTDTKALWKFIPVTGGYNIQNVHTGLYINGATMSETPGLFTLDVVAEENGTKNAVMGQFYIKIDGGNNCIHSTDVNAKSWGGAGLGNQYKFEEVNEFSHTLSVTDAGWATLVLGFNATIPANVKAYTIESEEGNYVTLAGATGVLKANVPVIVEATEGNYDFAYTTEPATVETSGLEGTLYNKNITENAYVLGNLDGEVGLAMAKLTDGAFLNNANKAYYVPSTANGFTAYSFRFGGNATAIESVKSELDLNASIYDLSGRRVKAATKGIYIQNGKKFIVK